MMRRSLGLLAACALVLAAAPARSQSLVGVRTGYYALLRGGEIRSLFQDLVTAGDFSAGSAGVFAAHYFTPNFGAELSFDAYVPEVDFDANADPDPNAVIPAHTSAGFFPISLSARYRLWPDRVTPFGVAGISVVPYRFDIESSFFPDLGVSQSGVRLGYQLGVGAELPFGVRWMASGEILYRGVDFETELLAPDGTLLKYQPNFSGVQFLVGLAYLF
jgi:outer membrane protein with beta-barrel domain